jgi:3-dehydroquinate dehydratase / shikimate dehydrogenase
MPNSNQLPASDAPRICVVIGRTRHKMMQAEIQEAAKRGARLLELRLDFLSHQPDFKRLLAEKPCAMVATVRRRGDGGRWAGTEEARRMLLRQAVVAGFDWVDVETDVASDIRRFKDVKRIISYHNIHEVPKDLESIYEKMCGQDGDVYKIAVMAQQVEDNIRVMELLKKAPKPTVAICMGEIGMPSRVLAARNGAAFTYAAFNKERGVAPGIPSFDDIKNLYRYEQINTDTVFYGVVGDPVAHSLGPQIHNRVFKQLGVNAVYLPMRVPRGQMPNLLKHFDTRLVKGYSVTIPHKEAAAILADVQDEPVKLTQAANTLVHTVEGWKAFNTDYQAVIDSLMANLPAHAAQQSNPLNSRTVLVLGAGGIARAVTHALHREGAVVAIANRTAERAHKLAEEVGCRAVEWAARHNVLCDLLINCTSVGMHPHMDESPIHQSYLKETLTVFDTVYTPETTLLVKEARARGCHVITGVDLFVRQAAQQFQLFTGKEAPVDLMRQVIRRILSPVTIKD